MLKFDLPMVSLFERYENNPILEPRSLPIASEAVFNSGVALYDGRFVMLANVWDSQWRPGFYVAWSDDGKRFEMQSEPAITAPKEYPFNGTDGIFDTRITQIGDEYFICYNVASHLGGRIRLASTRDFESFEDRGYISAPDHRNCVLFPQKFGNRYARLERPNVEDAGDIYISFSPDLIHWGDTQLVLERGFRYWASAKIGPSSAPLLTEEGWLILYHGARKAMSGFSYHAGCFLTDRNDPSKVIGRMGSVLMTPEKSYEVNGQCPYVVFPTAALLPEDNDRLWIYYGGGDRTMNLGFSSVKQLVRACLDES